MPKTRQQKAETIERLAQQFKSAKSVVFVDYRGLKVAHADALRKQTRAAQVEYLVAKKTLFTRAAREAGYDVDVKSFPGMIGAAFSHEDEMAPAKVLGDVSKDASLTFVGGIFEGALVGAEKVLALSKLPSKKELLGQVVATIAAPLSALVRALNALRESREQGSAPQLVGN